MTQIRESCPTASTSHNTNGGDIEVVTTDTRFATKLDSIDDVPEPMRGALVEKVPFHESIRLLVHAPDPGVFLLLRHMESAAEKDLRSYSQPITQRLYQRQYGTRLPQQNMECESYITVSSIAYL